MAVDQIGWFMVIGRRMLPGPIFETRRCLTKKRIRTRGLRNRMEAEGFKVIPKIFYTASMDFCVFCGTYISGQWVDRGRDVIYVCPKCKWEINIFSDE